MTDLERFLANSRKLSKGQIGCKEIPKDKVRDFKEGIKLSTKDWQDYKNPYPYCREFRIVKFFDKEGNWIGESQSTLVVVDGSIYALLYCRLDGKVNQINKIVIEDEGKARDLLIEFYLKEFELPLIRLKDFGGNIVIK